MYCSNDYFLKLFIEVTFCPFIILCSNISSLPARSLTGCVLIIHSCLSYLLSNSVMFHPLETYGTW